MHVYSQTNDPVEKQRHNELYATNVAAILAPGYMEIHLDHIEMATSRTLVRHGVPPSIQYVPEMDFGTSEKMKQLNLANVSNETLNSILLKQQIGSIGAMFADFCKTWSTCCADVKLAFDQRLFAAKAVLAITACGRGCMRQTEINLPNDVRNYATSNGYIATLCKMHDLHSKPQPRTNGICMCRRPWRGSASFLETHKLSPPCRVHLCFRICALFVVGESGS